MRRLILSCSLLCAVAVSAAPELSPRVRMVSRGDLAPRALSDGSADPRAVLVVRVDGGAAALRRAGFEARTLSGQWAEVRGERALLTALAALPQVRSIEERRLLVPMLDAAGPAVRAPEARAETGLTGQGVLVAVVDTGVDFRHADLRGADGKSRVAALIDLSQTPDNRHPELGDAPGRVFLKDDIDAVLAAEQAGMTPAVPITQRDTNGHGTHVSAVAVSGGLATDKGLQPGRYLGIAPGAELVVVQASRGGNTFTDGDVLTACRFVVALATQLGRPLVLNLSLGGAGGPHDGTAALELGLDELFAAHAPGRAVVVAAGNDGARDYHAALWHLDGEASVPVSVPTTSAGGGQVSFEIWYSGEVALSVESPSGARTAFVAPGASGMGAASRDGRAVIDNASGGPRPDGRRSASVVLEGVTGAPPASGTWTLHLSGTASRWDAYILESLPSASPTRFADHISVDDLLALPATARNAIVVGSFVSKPSWLTVDGQIVMRRVTLGASSSFSASGPTFDGRFAPDLVAPGEFVGAALSADAPGSSPGSAFFVPGNPTLAVLDDGLHGALRGTSQAAPVVAGAAALLLQANPQLTPTAVRELLRTSARGEGAGFSSRTGFGKLDVLMALRLARGLRGGAVSPSVSTVATSRDALPPGGEQAVVSVIPRDSAGTPLGPGHQVEMVTASGTALGPVSDAGAGRYERTFIVTAPRGSLALFDVTVDGVRLESHAQIFVVRDRSEIGQPFAARGGCDASPSAGGAGALALVALLIVWRTLGKIRARRRSAVPFAE